MIKKDVTWEQLQEMRGNTAFWTQMFYRMDNNCFIKQAQHYLNNCSFTRHKNTTYDDSVMNTVLPEALRRIEELEKQNNTFRESLEKIIKEDIFLSPYDGEEIHGECGMIALVVLGRAE